MALETRVTDWAGNVECDNPLLEGQPPAARGHAAACPSGTTRCMTAVMERRAAARRLELGAEDGAEFLA